MVSPEWSSSHRNKIKSEIDNPTPENLYSVGTLARILQLLKMPDGTIKVLVEGVERIKVSKIYIKKHKLFIVFFYLCKNFV